ncbi:DUF3005 domain-containing protein [Paraburkholderia sp. NMBU_R16]|uniref:DUF3005 domain-containing protein n=1 Tax=Paraburkholderia sp. NMBU_R16 TaxID=2698676 RepID=UPI0015652AC2|nr:DUF3005 domain-containing protein [Paraburkholderia sp. NMBU_R16]
MENNEHNPTQSQQNEIAAKSPAKTPAAGSASPDAATQAREFGSTRHATSAQTVAAKEPAPLPTLHRQAPEETGDPVARANARIHSVDNAGMAATDDTVDTDGKGLEARRGASQWQDNVIYSNATLDNSIPVRSEGLVDWDSRIGGTMPVIATRAGWQVVRRGTIAIPDRHGTHAEQVFTLDRIGN